jgi:isoleucyl-tRNA synthetase
MVQEVTAQMELLDLQRAVDTFTGFLDLLTNWYIRRSRRRFWKSGEDRDKREAYATLHAALLKLCLVASPFMPFLTEEIWRNLRPEGSPDSIHLADWPAYNAARRDPALERVMAVTVRAVSMGRSLRTEYGLKVRQPLSSLHLATRDPEERAILAGSEELIREELNVKLVLFRDNEEDLVEYKAKANFRVLGKTLGKAMKAAAAQIERLGATEIRRLLDGGNVTLDLEGQSFEVSTEGVEVQRIEKEGLKVVNQGTLTVALDPELTEDLVQEGLVRDLVRGIQNLRKEQGFAVTDRIVLTLDGPDPVRGAVERFKDHLLAETLAVSWSWGPAPKAVEIECGDGTVRAAITRAPA